MSVGPAKGDFFIQDWFNSIYRNNNLFDLLNSNCKSNADCDTL